uniref:P-type ATPase A domain-containing protein n=1 Tax=Attheya septentrionalis TaxID=420275 RepID=A0A7S2ULL4_9STRA|mmetsp:Transcript_3320/g.6049  ORF Transcript_3320/g.6049 Transcript_3320/m.6049 type:complete len:225 (+) Transcript_3320:41-715(+)
MALGIGTMVSEPANLSRAQMELLEAHGVESMERGLTVAQAAQRRECLNVVRPPVDCPAWLCIVLPCIGHLPSMVAFAKLKPEDAEVKRDSQWVCYDAVSVVTGDILRLTEGDVVPADCTVLQLVDGGTDEVLVDTSAITGEDRPRSITRNSKDNTTKPVQLFYGSYVLQGSVIAIVTAVGDQTMLAHLICAGTWPPKGNIVLSPDALDTVDEEAGVSLITRDTL